MEIFTYGIGIAAIVVFGIAALLGVLHLRDPSIWTTWFACVLSITGGFCWLQDREWKKDSSATPADTTLQAISTKQDAIMAAMAKYEATYTVALAERFPLGYTLFTMKPGANVVIPFQRPSGEPFTTKWATNPVSISGEEINLQLPEIMFSPGMGFLGCDVAFPNRVGSGIRLDIDLKNGGSMFVHSRFSSDRGPNVTAMQIGPKLDTALVAEIVAKGVDDQMVVLGLKPLE